MGNIFGRLAEGPNPPFEPNIPFNQNLRQNNLNNPNHPYSYQMQDIVLHYAVPFLCVAAYAHELKRRKDEKRQHVMEVLTKEIQLKDEIQKLSKENQQLLTSQLKVRNTDAQIQELEEKENIKLQSKLKQLQYYEKGLESILDIRCSHFKSKDRRFAIQDDLVTKLSDPRFSDLSGTVKYLQLKDIYAHDYHFCSDSRKTNGKLRQLYIQQWRMQFQLEKYKNILNAIEK